MTTQDQTSAELITAAKVKIQEEIADLENAIEVHKAALQALKRQLKKLEE